MLLCKLDFVRDDLCRSTELKLHHHDLGHKRGIVSHHCPAQRLQALNRVHHNLYCALLGKSGGGPCCG